MPPASSPPLPDIITAATPGRLLAAVRACVDDRVTVAYKNTSSLGTLIQVEGVLTDTGGGTFTLCVADDSTGYVTAFAQFDEHALTGFAPPNTYRKPPVIFVR